MVRSRLMTAMTAAFALAANLGAGAAAAPPVDPGPEAGGGGALESAYTWEGLVADIERTHPLMDAARAGLAQLDAKLAQAEWAIFPTFKLEAGGTITPMVTGDALDSDTTWDTVGISMRVELSMVQPLWTFGKIGALQEAARHGVDVGKSQVEVARWELRVRAAQAYQGRLLSIELERILSDGRVWLEKAERRMEKLREEDSVDYDQLEHLRLKARVAEFFTLDADNRLLTTQTTQGLRILLSLPRGSEVALAADRLEPVAYTPQTAERYVAEAMRSEPGLLAATALAKARGALADHREAELLPDLVLVGEASAAYAGEVEDQNSRFANDPYNSVGAGAALGLRWNLDVPRRLQRADEARAEARRAREELEVARDLLELKVRSLAQELENKRDLLEVFRQSQRAAQGWLTMTWDTYDAGFGGFRDVMDALVQFYAKKFGYLQQVYEHNLLVWRLSQAVGVDITTLTSDKAPSAE